MVLKKTDQVKSFLWQVIIISIFILSFACDSDLFKPKKPPVITDVDVSAYEVDPGDSVRVAVSVQDEDDAILKFEWSKSGGQFVPPTDQYEIIWVAPAVGGLFQLSVIVSNQEKSADPYTIEITVRSYVKPFVQIISPEDGIFIVQHEVLEVKATASHQNGINHVNLYLNDVFKSRQSGNAMEVYDFVCELSDPPGATEVKVEALANTTGTVACDSMTILIEGVVLGK